MLTEWPYAIFLLPLAALPVTARHLPLRSLIRSSTISRLPYDDGKPLFISLVGKNLSFAIYDVQSTVSLDSGSMSSNYVNTNPSKTEFLVIDLPQ